MCRQSESLFELMGGLTGVKNLAEEFYNVMEHDVNAQSLRGIHPEKLISARKNLFRFLSEWLGGPALFGAQHVTVKWLELRHRRFGLAREHTDQWLYCMDQAMTNLGFDQTVKARLNEKFSSMIESMRKQRERVTGG